MFNSICIFTLLLYPGYLRGSVLGWVFSGLSGVFFNAYSSIAWSWVLFFGGVLVGSSGGDAGGFCTFQLFLAPPPVAPGKDPMRIISDNRTWVGGFRGKWRWGIGSYRLGPFVGDFFGLEVSWELFFIPDGS